MVANDILEEHLQIINPNADVLEEHSEAIEEIIEFLQRLGQIAEIKA